MLTQPLLRPGKACETVRLPRLRPTDDRTGLDHLAVAVTDAAEVVAAVTPTLRAARLAGHPITAIAGRRTVGLLREAIGEVVSLSPAEVLRPGPERLITTLCDEARRARSRAFVLLEHPATADPVDVAEWEAACTLVLADRPLTLVCACARDTGPETVDAVAAGHPVLVGPSGRYANPDHRPPPDRSLSPAGLWGRRVLRFTVSGPADLDRLEVRVGRTALSLGNTEDEAAAAVRAAEDAVAVAGRDGDTREVELRTLGARLVIDVTGPAGGVPIDPTETVDVPDGGAAALHDDGTARRVRVLCPAGALSEG